MPVRRQYVISDENGKFDQYNDFKETDINFPDHDYSFEVVEEDDNQNPNYPRITDNDNENFPSFAIEPRFSRKTNSQTSFSHGARHLHHRHSKKYYPHTEEIIIVTPSESQNRQYYLRAIQAPVRGRRNNLHRRSPNNNINVNTNGYKSDSIPQHLSEDVSLSKPQLIGELIDQESNLEKPQPLTDSVSLLEILNNDHDQSDRQNSKNNNVNVDTNVNERAYLARRHSLDENKNVNVNVNSNIDNDFDERAIGPAVIVNARKNLKLLGLNRRDIDALRSERRNKNQNSNTNSNSNDAGFYVRPEPIPAPVFTDRNVPYIILDSPRSLANAAYRKNNKNTNVNVNTNDINSQEYY